MSKYQTEILGVKAKRGVAMKSGRGWRLISPGEMVFKASLVKHLRIGDETVALFRVLRASPD
jgi:hypothetical protein